MSRGYEPQSCHRSGGPDGLHVIGGAGGVARSLAAELTRRGQQVRVLSRSGTPVGAGEVRRADIRDAEQCRRVCEGAVAVYGCMNAPYHRWDLFPALQSGLLAGAESAGATYVAMENVYGYGQADLEPFTEFSQMRPCSDKGEIRAKMWDELVRVHESGRVATVAVRASDFYGPGVRESLLGHRFWEAVLAGRSAPVMGSLHALHTVTYIGDVGRALADVGSDPGAWGRAWHVPNAPADTIQRLGELAFAAAGGDGEVKPTPRWLLRAVGLMSKPASGLVEMLYQFERDFVVDGSALSDRFGWEATSLAEGFAATIAWMKEDSR